MMFVCNLTFATAAIAASIAAPTESALEAAIQAASPTVLEIYAINMVFAAIGKMNPAFFDPMISAATAHVMASVENIACSLPRALQAIARRSVDAAGTRWMHAFFGCCCIGGFAVEAAVPLLMYANAPRTQLAIMAAMHSLFR